MKTTVENLDPSRIKLSVEVPYEEPKPSLDAAYKEIGSQIQVPGFRPRHVPNPVIDQPARPGPDHHAAPTHKPPAPPQAFPTTRPRTPAPTPLHHGHFSPPLAGHG